MKELSPPLFCCVVSDTSKGEIPTPPPFLATYSKQESWPQWDHKSKRAVPAPQLLQHLEELAQLFTWTAQESGPWMWGV